MGRVGSRKPGILVGRVGLGQDFYGSGQVGSSRIPKFGPSYACDDNTIVCADIRMSLSNPRYR